MTRFNRFQHASAKDRKVSLAVQAKWVGADKWVVSDHMVTFYLPNGKAILTDYVSNFKESK